MKAGAWLLDVPGSAQYIGPRQLEKFSYNDIQRILRDVPGVNIQEEDGYGLRPNIGMRGTGSERSSKITVMEDGVLMAPAPYAAPAAYYFPTAGRMQGVEVRKGSSQIKHGPYTTGGALNLISTQIPNEFAGHAEVLAGADDDRTIHAHVGHAFENVGFLFERDWFKLDRVRAGSDGDRVKIANILNDPQTFAAEYAILRGATSTNDNALEVKHNNRSYYAQGVQTVVGLRFDKGRAAHDVEIGVRRMCVRVCRACSCSGSRRTSEVGFFETLSLCC